MGFNGVNEQLQRISLGLLNAYILYEFMTVKLTIVLKNRSFGHLGNPGSFAGNPGTAPGLPMPGFGPGYKQTRLLQFSPRMLTCVHHHTITTCTERCCEAAT